MTLSCPQCRRSIPLDDVNVGKDVALCRGCGVAHSFADLMARGHWDEDVDLRHPPPGAWYGNQGFATVMGATHRSWGTALAALAFGLFWNGILSIFVLLATSSTLGLMHVVTPEWFPAPRMNGGTMGVGFTVFLWIFLTPFLAIGATMVWTFANSLFGRTEVRIGDGSGVVFTGIGPVGWRRRFDPRSIREVRIETLASSNRQAPAKTRIVLVRSDANPISFGSALPEDRRRFLTAALRRSLA